MKLFNFPKNNLGSGSFSREHGEFRWELSQDGCLTIRGSGKLEQDIESCRGNSGDGWDSHYDTEETEWPWEHLKDKVKKIVIEEGIT